MLNVPSTSAGPASARFVKVARFDESPSQRAFRLRQASNCCEESRHSWKEFERAVTDMASIPESKFYEIIPRLVRNIKSMDSVARGVLIDEHARAMRSDGSMKYFSNNGISGDDISSGEFMHSEIKMSKLVSLLDKSDVPGAAKDFLCHFYLKMILSTLAEKNTGEAFRLHTVMHRGYHADNNRAYPLLKLDGSMYKINAIQPRSSKGDTGRDYSCRPVKPFISSKLTGEQREKLYDQLEVRRLGPKDLRANEFLLLGQYGVFAARKISAGTCIGVHGGTFFSGENLAAELGIPLDEMLRAVNMDYMVWMNFGSNNSESLFLDGNNIISKINTLFFQGGMGWRQASGCYNAEGALFKCEMDDGRDISLHAIFAARDIESGEEIRMNYHYSPEVVAQIMRNQESAPAESREDLVKSILDSIQYDSCEVEGQ